MRGHGRRTAIVDFIKDVVSVYEERHGRTADAVMARKVGVKEPTFHAWLNGGHGITLENLENLTFKLLGIHFFQCLYFPDEVSELKAIEVDTLNRLEHDREARNKISEVKKPGSAARDR